MRYRRSIRGPRGAQKSPCAKAAGQARSQARDDCGPAAAPCYRGGRALPCGSRGNPSDSPKKRSTRQAFKSSYCVRSDEWFRGSRGSVDIGITGRLGETTTMQQAHLANLTYRLHQQRLQMATSIELRVRFLTKAFHAQLRSEKELIASRTGRFHPGICRAFLEARRHQLN